MPEPAPFASVFVTPSSYLTSDINVQYLFTVRAIGPIPKNAFVYLVVPTEDIKIYNEWLIQRDCEDYFTSGLPLLNDLRLPRIDCTVRRQRTIDIIRMFEYGDTNDYPTFQFTIPGLQNPRVIQQASKSFELYIYEDVEMKY